VKEDLESDVCIIGAGPIGCYLANSLEKNNIKTTVVEEHKEIGKPFQCTGLLSENIFKLIDLPKELIMNKIKGARFFFSNNKPTTLKGKILVIDRINFDKYLYEKAKSAGAKFLLNESFENFSLNEFTKIKTNKREIKSKIIVGADGPQSKVGKILGITHQSAIALQVRAKIKRDPAFLEVHFGEDVCPKFFAWVVPENENVSRIGLVALKNTKAYLDKFLKKLRVTEIIDRQAGPVPTDFLKKTSSERAILVGDAASQVKATSGGGIITGMFCAKDASEAIKLAIKKNNFSEAFLQKEYDSRWQNGIGKELLRAYNIRMILNEFSDEEYELLYRLSQEKDISTRFEETVDLEIYSDFIPELARHPKIALSFMSFALRKPHLLKYALQLV
jgi:geranylgeranyl reductase family protein